MTAQGVNPSSPYAPCSYAYDPAGRLSTLVNPFSERTSFAYDGADRLTKKTLTDGYNGDGFGNLMSRVGSNPTALAWGEASGYRSDNDSGLRLLGHRYYESRTGRFLSQDPAGSGGNWYAYCGNSPTNGDDPSGLEDSAAGTPPGDYTYPDGRQYTVEQDGSISMNGSVNVQNSGGSSTSGDITGPQDAGDFGLRGGVDDAATFGTVTMAGNAWGAVDSGHGSRAAAIGATALAGLAVLAFATSDGEDAAAVDGTKAIGWIAKDAFSTLKQDVGQEMFERFLAALKQGVVGPEGRAGIKVLKGNIGFTHELKIGGSSARLLGNVEEWNGLKTIVFRRLTMRGLH